MEVFAVSPVAWRNDSRRKVTGASSTRLRLTRMSCGGKDMANGGNAGAVQQDILHLNLERINFARGRR